ncbi:hypothetical protein Sjap_019693 [Stephania japonica]|uniref:Protein kinase domain-containing protein n=1 Tax=Stephania japonica TaxID=461633 RepID=A0AAP0EZX6_9MAGN
MCQLTQLLTFDVKGNSLTGSIPDNIGNCTSLQMLDLSYNQLTGEIPPSVGFLQVATLDLGSNLLSGPIPSVLGNLVYTVKLYLNGNKLTGPIPPELGNMSTLNYMGLENNLLTGGIPPELGKLTTLYYLNLANNKLEGAIPENLSSCTNLNDLDLHGNWLNGTIPPSFKRLKSMTNLTISSNKLTGPFPVVVSQIANLDNLDLSDNMISGPISSSIGDLEHLLKLNLSKNNLTGHIPAEFGNLKSIMSIDLSTNHLSGPLPQELGQLQNLNSLRVENNNLSGDILFLSDSYALTFLNVSNNNLAGDIPISTNVSNSRPDSFLGNSDLCGYLLKSSCYTSQPMELHKATFLKAAVLGTVVGVLLIFLVILAAVWRPHIPASCLKGSFEKPVSSVNPTSPKLVILDMNISLHVYDDIMKLTENLSAKYIIGRGTSSTVYKCTLKNCRPVAIKRLHTQYRHSLKQFETELETIGCVKHRNLVSLQGYALSPSGSLLVYDYMENGSLWDILHGSAKKQKLDWNTRLKIALGAAQGLAYLHHDCSPHIIHRDVKSPNILLDKDFEAHLADFGIAKSMSKSHSSTSIAGSIGYIDPEYAETSRLTEKSDVYSYGVVLLELLTGRKIVDDDSNLHQLVSEKSANDAVMEIVDPEISATCKDLGAVKKAFQLALLCTKRQSSDRPPMLEVVHMLVLLCHQSPPIH